MKDGICLPIREDISSAGMLSNMLHSQHDTKSKNHRETNYWRKITPKDLFPRDENDSLVPRSLARSGGQPCNVVLALCVARRGGGTRHGGLRAAP